MTTTINTEFATILGREFAAQVNACARDRDNWRAMTPDDAIADGDFAALQTQYGYWENLEHAEITAIERAYKAGFNAVFVPLDDEPEPVEIDDGFDFSAYES